MLASMLSKFLASLLVAVLAGATITAVLNQTVLDSHYVEAKLASTDSYNRLSVALDDQITKKAGSTDDPASAEQVAKLKTILTPTLLQTKINSALDQMQAYYRGNGAQPVIDLTDVAAQAQAAGIPIPADSGINKPIKLSSSARTQDVSRTFDHVRTGTIISSLLLVVALLAVSWERHKWAALPDVLIVVGVLVGLLALVFGLASGQVGHYVKFDTSSNAFAGIGRDLATAIASDLARRFGIIAGVFLAVGVATRVLVARLHSNVPVKTALKTGFQQPIKN